MKQIRLEGEPRTLIGSTGARALRRSGKIPAIVYGFGETATAVQLNLRDVLSLLKEHSEHALINLVVNGKSENVVVRDLQFDTLRRQPLHIDFQRVRMDEEVSLDVEVVLEGVPVGVREGGILEFFTRTLHVRALPQNLPEVLRVDVTNLGMGDALHVRDLPLPEGITIVSDPDTVVVTVAPPRVEAEITTPTAVEPEVVTKRPAEET